MPRHEIWLEKPKPLADDFGMKTLFLSLFLLPSLAQAGGLTCSVNQYYSRFWLKWNDSTVTMEVYNPRGFKGMPQMEAPFSQESIPMLEFQSKELSALGESFVFSWDKKQCEWSKDDQILVSCHGGSKDRVNGIRAMSFTTARIEENSLSGKNSLLRLRFIFEKSSLFFVAMPFPKGSCFPSE